jgi:hypothetical protein
VLGRRNLNELGAYDRRALGVLKRKVRSPAIPSQVAELHRENSNWKQGWYALGERLTVDASPFLGSS